MAFKKNGTGENYKPDSVRPVENRPVGHTSSRRVSAPVKQLTRELGRTTLHRIESTRNVPLFSLAPDRVYHASHVATEPVSSYLTFSPLPWRARAVYFLWHFP